MDKSEIIKFETEELLKKIVDKFEVEVSQEDDAFHISIKTEEEAPRVIGRHGETIRALQKILEVIFYKKFGQPVNILVNVNDYREKQRQRLEALASQYAQKAQSLKKANFITGLSSYERKVIHEYITKNYPDLTTYSLGEGRERRLVIDVKENKDKLEK